jgi:signal transduction histidine kinase
VKTALKSIGFDIALKVAAATLVISAAVFAFVYGQIATQSQRAIIITIDTDMAGLVDIYAAEGQAGLIRRLEDRLGLKPQGSEIPYYRLSDAQGRKLSGNLLTPPDLDAARSGTGRFTLPSGEAGLARATRLKGGLELIVGRSATLRDNMLYTVALVFGFALILIAAAAFGVGLWAAERLRRRVGDINTVFQNVQQGQLSARIPVIRPSDELDQLGLNVNVMLERIEALMAAQRDVTDNIAHETRTPLMRLDASLMAAQNHAHDPEMAEELEKSRSQIKGLLRLFDALLDIASAKARRGDTSSLSLIDLSPVAHSLIDLYQGSADEAGLILESEIADNVTLQGDAMQMSRLMVNLLDNAFKYGSDGGYVRFRLTAGPVITVEDHGEGIPEGEREAVFQRFHRGTSDRPGHGLGLALVSAIAARHGLKIRVEDAEPGRMRKGARFVVSPERQAR